MLKGQSQKLGTSLVVILALLTALDAMAIDMYLPAMPVIAEHMAVSAGKIQLTLSVFLCGLAFGQAIYGPLLDSFGRRAPLLAGIGIFAVGSILAALSPSLQWLLVARFIQAIGASAGLVTPRAIVTDMCSVTESALIFSILMQVMMIAPIMAPIIGSFLLGHGGWRFVFGALALISVAGFIWGWKTLPDSLPQNNRVPFNLHAVITGYAGITRSAAFVAYTLAGGCVLGSLFTYISSSAFVFTGHFSLTPSQFSYLFAGNSVALVLGGQISSILLKRAFREESIMFFGLAIHTFAGLALLFFVMVGQPDLWSYAALTALAVGALGAVFGNMTALTMNSIKGQAGIASSFMGAAQYLISAVIGYAASMLPQNAMQLPLAILICGLLSCAICLFAHYKGANTDQKIIVEQRNC
ncbi:multidrug effflux MFS transporter [uncultured Desulfovibrio sp.]|uniref:multidrug effflux MFS transporter n=1 Tax=uncultured Desulfovibrio sp. TaxID=167968 RepID=UPI0026395995|nr:multidrug effflux MFS transporter [uncultured Desulfovibrio sp.]